MGQYYPTDDEQLKSQVLSQIAYWDFNDNYEMYAASGINPTLDMLLTSEQITYLEEDLGVPSSKLDSWLAEWSVVGVDENPGTQFRAVMVDTGNNNVNVSFRGTLFFSSDSFYTSWYGADFRLLTDTCTDQQADVIRFLQNNKELLGQYGNVNFDGHSLGGNLAMFAAFYVASHRDMFDFEDYTYISLDGPWFNQDFYDQFSDAEIREVLEHGVHYNWSGVGQCLRPPEGYSFVDWRLAVEDDPEHLGPIAYFPYKHDLKFLDVNGGHFNYDTSPSVYGFLEYLLNGFTGLADDVDLSKLICLVVLKSPLLYALIPDDVHDKISDTIKNFILEGVGYFGTGCFVIAEYFNGTYADIKAIKETERIAADMARNDPTFYVSTKGMVTIAENCHLLEQKLEAIKSAINTPASLPSYSTYSQYSYNPIIASLLSGMMTIYSNFNVFTGNLVICSGKLDDMILVSKNAYTYASNCSTGFKTAEYVNIYELQHW